MPATFYPQPGPIHALRFLPQQELPQDGPNLSRNICSESGLHRSIASMRLPTVHLTTVHLTTVHCAATILAGALLSSTAMRKITTVYNPIRSAADGQVDR